MRSGCGAGGISSEELTDRFTAEMRDRFPNLSSPEAFATAAPRSLFVVSSIERIEPLSHLSARVHLRRGGASLEAVVTVGPTEPHPVASLLVTLEGGVSMTAVNVAISRGLHRRLTTTRVFDDWLIERIGGPFVAETVENALTSPQPGTPPVMPLARFRFCEDILAGAITDGYRQYVILGAGPDTYAYRNPDPPAGFVVYEVDAPTTQAWKRRKLNESGIIEPAHVRYVSVDFERDDVSARLRASGFDPNQLSVVSWLGVTYYLTATAIERTLRTVATWSTDTLLVVDYFRPSSTWDQGMRAGATQAATSGEPWITTFDDDELDGVLRACGLTSLERLTSSDALQRYPTGTPLAANEATVTLLAAVAS